MKWQNVIQLISNRKSKVAVFKSKLSCFSEIGKLITGLANIDTGHVIIGLDIQNLHVLGAKVSSEWIESNIKKQISINLKFKVFKISKNEKDILVLKILRQDHKPFYFEKVCYVYDIEKEITYVSLFENKIKHQELKIKVASNTNNNINENFKNELNNRQNEAIKYLKKRFEIKNKIYRELCNVSHKTAHLELIDLVTKGVIEQIGAGRSTKYILKTV